ncbi:MAG: glycoside hydrolase family 65 protein [Clostridiaceae bacterium]|jgi:maltose phosphorylase|nr:glycoside hydrolase family 65 protein [Clostridiaceae bacterium]
MSLLIDEWRIIQEDFLPEENRYFESIMSSGNGRMGLRGNHEEDYSGDTLKGTYVSGVYYPDKTKVGWWKNGYPEYFAKVLNAIDFIGIKVKINGENIDLAACNFSDYKRELDMKNSVLHRSFVYIDPAGSEYEINTGRFISYHDRDIAAIRYSIKALNNDGELELLPFLNGDVRNEDANYQEKFWEYVSSSATDSISYLHMKTLKTNFNVSAAFAWSITGTDTLEKEAVNLSDGEFVGTRIKASIPRGKTITLEKYISVISDRYYETDKISNISVKKAQEALDKGYNGLFSAHKKKWADIWSMGDISISGDTAAQQGIRFNIYQLNCMYSGDDPRLNIGPKGFTGEKYGGGTYWDTEAYCLYFYLGTRKPEIARNLLEYRYNHLEKAKENSAKLGTRGALYPMVTMNGEECHNEWEITFEEIHRNCAITYAIKNYTEYTNDESYLLEKGIDVLVETSRYWVSRVNYNSDKNVYMILGVTGPNEYENNVNNNWYTNRMVKWSLQYSVDTLKMMEESHKSLYRETIDRLGISPDEIEKFKDISEKMYLPEDKKLGIFLQQDGFLDKEIIPAECLKSSDLPLNQNWSWDRILRSCYIKQADVIQGLWFLNDEFTKEEKIRNFDFYEPLTVHESSLSPCVHSILAAETGREEKAYELYLRTARLDLDNYNKDTDDGLHITSMAGTWMSIIYGFAGMRIKKRKLYLSPFKPESWKEYSFFLVFRGRIINITVCDTDIIINLEKGDPFDITLYGENVTVREGRNQYRR